MHINAVTQTSPRVSTEQKSYSLPGFRIILIPNAALGKADAPGTILFKYFLL